MHAKTNMTKSKLTKVISVSVLMLCCIFFISSITNAAIYYVDATSGNDSNAGLSPSSPWKTIGKVNGFNFSNGDTVRFKRGSTFNDATLGSPGVDNFTFEDYGSGAKPLFDGDVNKPVLINDATISNLTIRNIDISGQDWQLAKSTNLHIRLVNGVTIDGVIGDGINGSSNSSQIGKTAITLYETTGTVTVKNCTLYNWGPIDLPKTGADLVGISLFRTISGTVQVHDNTIYNIQSQAVLIFESTVTVEIFSNTFWNCGEYNIAIKGASNVEVHDNDLYKDPGFGTGGSGGINALLNITDYSGDAENNIVRNNYFHDTEDAKAIHVGGFGGAYSVDNNKIYRNIFEDTAGVILITNNVYNTLFYQNIIINPDFLHLPGGDKGCIYENNPAGAGNKIYNNTIYNNTGDCLIPINLNNSQGTEVKNNIVYHNSADPDAWAFFYEGYGSGPIVDHNNFYNSSSTNRVKWINTTYSSSQLSNWRSAGHSGALFDDLLFLDATSKDFHLQSTSPAIDAGTNVGLTQDYEGNTISGTTDMGVYEYVSGGTTVSDTTPPLRSNGQPTGTLSSGTTSITLSLSTDEPSTCRYSIAPGTSYPSMANTFSTTGGTSHSTTISGLQDGQTYTYYIRCQDSAGNYNTDDYLISFSVAATMQQNSITSLKTETPITIDGNLSENVWSQANYVTFSNSSRSDNQVKVYSLYDDNNLYFAYDITDSNLEALNQKYWHDDGIEIYLDTQNNKTTSMDSNDYSFMANINDLVSGGSINTKTTSNSNGYIMEIAIPWTTINTTSASNIIMGLLLGNNDRDNGVKSQFDWLNLIETGSYSRPNLWGDILLSSEIASSVDTIFPTPPVGLLIQ